MLRVVAVAAALVIALTYALTLWTASDIIRSSIVEATEEANRSVTRTLANELWPELRPLVAALDEAPVDELARRPEVDALSGILARFTRGTDVLAIKIFSLSGSTLYASDRDQIGQDRYDTAGFRSARLGVPYSAISTRSRIVTLDGDRNDRTVVSTYVPLLDDLGGVAAVFELYTDRTQAVAAAGSSVRHLVLTTLPVVAVATGLLVVLLLQAARRQQRQTAALWALVEENEAARAAAEDADRAKSRFLATVSHELRTPMNGIVGLCYVALRDDPPPALRNTLGKIDASARALMGSISAILDFSRLEDGRVDLEAVPLRPRAVAGKVLAAAARDARTKGLRLELAWDEAIPHAVLGDEARLTQVLGELVGNAVKFTDAGGVILRADHGGTEPDGRARLRFVVQDTGIGMTEAQRARLFRGAYQADDSTTRRHGGLGLGLAVAHRLTTLMGGTLDADSRPGEGSRFCVDLALPVVDVPAEEAPAAEMPAADPEPPEAPAVLAPADQARAVALLASLTARIGDGDVTATEDADALAEVLGGGPLDDDARQLATAVDDMDFDTAARLAAVLAEALEPGARPLEGAAR